jgi:hypothetical protein
MIPTHDHSNDIPTLIMIFIVQIGVWTTEHFAQITFEGVYQVLFDIAKLAALIASIWASYRVGKKNGKHE